MHSLGRYYVSYINHKYDRSGSLWDGRYKACLVQEETYLLRCCMRYIEMNPVRSGVEESALEYRWSSHHRNGYGGAAEWDDFLSPMSYIKNLVPIVVPVNQHIYLCSIR